MEYYIVRITLKYKFTVVKKMVSSGCTEPDKVAQAMQMKTGVWHKAYERRYFGHNFKGYKMAIK